MDMYQKRKKRQEMKNNENKEKIQSQMNINWYPGQTNNRGLKISRPCSRSIRCKNTNFKSKSRYPRIHKK